MPKVCWTDRPGCKRYAAILWQLSACNKNCKDCYVKGSLAASIQRLGKQEEVRRHLLETKKLYCNQLTISVDKDARHFIGLVLRERHKFQETKLHLTVKSFKTWLEEIQLPLDGVDMLTLSKPVKDKEELEKLETLLDIHPNLRLGLNVILTDYLPWRLDIQPFLQKKLVHSIYVIFKKPRLGGLVRPGEIENFFKSLWTLQSSFKEVSKYTNLYLDHCISRQYTNLLTGKGYDCSAGIDRIHIWPDGSITGCPYDGDLVVDPEKSPRPEEHCDVARVARLYLSKNLDDFKFVKEIFNYA